MKKRMIITIAAALVIGAGTIYAVGTGYVQFGVPTQAEIDSSVSQAADAAAQKVAQELQVSSIAQEQALAELEAQVKQLEQDLQKPPESAASSSPHTSVSAAPAASSLPTPESKSIATAMAAKTPSAAAPAKPAKVENAGTVFEGYTVTVTDSKTPAEMAGGIDWPITKLYFFDSNGGTLGSISGTAYHAIMDKYKIVGPDGGLWNAPGANGNWEFWFAEEFNAYRGISGDSSENCSSGSSINDADTDAYALEVVELTNAKRRAAGLDELEIRQDMMDLAQVRAEEIAADFSHVRPDGVRISSLGYGENISKGRDTPAAAVKAWMNSEGHKENILTGEYKYIGVGCYVDNGTFYWAQLFSWNE